MVKQSAILASLIAAAAAVEEDEAASLLSVNVKQHKASAKQPGGYGYGPVPTTTTTTEVVEAAPPSLCPSGVGRTKEVDGKCYFVHTAGAMNIDQGRAWCNEHGGSLASIHSDEGNNAVLDLLNNNGQRSTAWIGALRVDSGSAAEAGKWTWEDGSTWNRITWPTDGLNHNGGSLHETRICVHSDGRWHDWTHGTTPKGVVCQATGEEAAPPPPPSSCPTGVGATAEVDGKCYFVKTDAGLSLDAGRDWCNSHDGELASIHSKDANDAVLDLLNGKGAWIGALREGSDAKSFGGEWGWEDGSEWSPIDWATDGLNHNKGTLHETRICIHTDRRWHDWTHGQDPKGVVCQSGRTGGSEALPAQKTFRNVCIEPHSNKFATLTLEEDMCVQDIEFMHRSGRVSCRKAESGDSKWGCDSASLGLVIADNGVVTEPVFGTVEGMRPHYSRHAHWYKINGVTGDSRTMPWNLKEPVMMPAKQYQLWYNEDLTGGTEGDNRGKACYDVTMHGGGSCDQLAPLQFGQVCTSAAGDAHGSIALPEGTCVTGIDLYWVSGKVSCRKAETGLSNFGCDNDLIGLVWTPRNQKTVFMPHAEEIRGITRTGHEHAHWYKANGVSRNTRTLKMRVKRGVKPLKVQGGGLDLWYNEDLTAGTEEDNSGTACYEVAVHRALHC